jgi:choice-of-anchor A domain-containing protein
MPAVFNYAKKLGITAVLLALTSSSSALADDFGLGTAGPGNWGILETGANQVSFSSNTGITANNPGASASQANLGINSGGKLNAGGNNIVVAGTYYRFSTNTSDNTNGFTALGGTNTTSDSLLTTAAAQASSASSNLANTALNPPNQTLGTITANTTISATVPGRNVINVTDINMGNGTILTLSGSATQSFVINVTGTSNVNFSNVLLVGGLTAANVIFNVLNGDTVTDNSPDVINGIIMDISGTVSVTNSDTINGEIISGNQISLSNNSDVQAVPTVPEASTTTYFTLGPLSLAAVMLLYKRFSRRKQTIVHDSHRRKRSGPCAASAEPDIVAQVTERPVLVDTG